MKILNNLLVYQNLTNMEALDFCKKNCFSPFPSLAIEISLFEKLKPIHTLSFYKNKPFLLVTLFPDKFCFDYLPYYGYIMHNSVRNWHKNKSTFRQILVDENIKHILETLSFNKNYQFSIGTEPLESDYRGVDWALTYNENLESKPLSSTFYTGILDIEPELILEDWIHKNFASSQIGTYKQAMKLDYKVENIDYLPKDLKNIYSDMFSSQKINIKKELLDRFIFIIRSYLEESFFKGEYLFFKKLNKEENIIGYDFFINFNNVSFYLFGINDPEFKKTSKPGYFWAKYREYFILNGINIIDLAGVNSPYRGRFKTSLGCDVVPYWHFLLE